MHCQRKIKLSGACRHLTVQTPASNTQNKKIISNPSLLLSLQARILAYKSVEGLHNKTIPTVFELRIAMAHLVDAFQPVNPDSAHILCKNMHAQSGFLNWVSSL